MRRRGLRAGDERAVAIGVAVCALIVLLIAAWFGFQRHDRQLDSNAVGVGAPIASPDKGQQLCVNNVQVPQGTRRLQMWFGAPKGATTVDLTFVSQDGEIAARRDIPVRHAVYQFIPAPSTSWNVADTARICLVPSNRLDVGGSFVGRLPDERPTTVDGKSIGQNEPAVHYYSHAGDRPLAIAQLPDMFARSSAFHGPLYPWLMLLAALAALAATGWGLSALVTADRRTVKQLAITFTIVTFSWACAWSILSPPFQGNDESEHFANLQTIAETGNVSDPAYGSPLPPYSSREQTLMNGYRHQSLVVDGTARPYWNDRRAAEWQRADEHAESDNGGGYTISASGHSGLYYALFAPAYKLTTWMKPANQLVVLRILNSAMGGFVALFAVLAAALLLGDRRRHAAAAAGALIAFQPMFAYVNATINNDTFVNLTSAAVLYLLIAIASLGWTLKREVWLGVLAVVGPVGKLTGATVSLVAAGFVALTMLRDRTKRALRGGLTVLAAVVGTALAWLATATVLGWPKSLANVHTNMPPNPPEWGASLTQRIDYIIQTAFPFIELTGPMTMVSQPLGRIYIVGGFGDFFWHRIDYPVWTYKLIAGVLIVVAIAGIAALVIHRRFALKNWLQIGVVLVYPVAVAALVGWAYATPGGRDPLAEQGRYIFPAIAALAIAAAGAAYGVPRRLRPYCWGALGGVAAAFMIVSFFYAGLHVYA